MSDSTLNEAWARITLNPRIRLPDTVDLLDEIEAIHGRPIMSSEYRSFWIDTVLSNPTMSVSKDEFKQLFQKMFDMDLTHALRVDASDRADLTSQITQSMRDETTQLQRVREMDSADQKVEYARRIRTLRMVLTENGTLSAGTELTINRKLVRYLTELNKIYAQEAGISGPKQIGRLNADVSRQEELVAALDKKFGERGRKGWHLRGFYTQWFFSKRACLILAVIFTALLLPAILELIYPTDNYTLRLANK